MKARHPSSDEPLSPPPVGKRSGPRLHDTSGRRVDEGKLADALASWRANAVVSRTYPADSVRPMARTELRSWKLVQTHPP